MHILLAVDARDVEHLAAAVDDITNIRCVEAGAVGSSERLSAACARA